MRYATLLVAIAMTLPFSTYAWTIDSFSSVIMIGRDGMVNVTEDIAADFADEEKHGIYRDIPYIYEDVGGDVYTRIADISVIQDGKSADWVLEHTGGYVRIRIGDKDATISGRHDYRINYRVEGVLRGFGGYDELYWNATGNGWDAPIREAFARVVVPVTTVQTACYQGPVGSEIPCSHPSGNLFSATDLAPGEGLTIAVGYEPGIIPILTVARPPSLGEIVLSPPSILAFAAVVILGLGILLRTYWRYGRDRFFRRSILPGVRSDRETAETDAILPFFAHRTIAVEYDAPDDLRPAEIGVLMDEKAHTLDISSTLVDLASRGHLEIEEIPKTWLFGSVDYRFIKKEASDTGLREYEKLLLRRLFDEGTSVLMSELKNTFYKDLKDVKDSLYAEVVARKLFPHNPESARAIPFIAGVFVVISATFSLFFVVERISVGEIAAATTPLTGMILGLIVVGIATLLASPSLSRRTAYGRELYERSLGYRMFVSGTETHRAKYAENANLFTRVLPYAIVFGVTGKLAAAFEEMGITPREPAWYHGSAPFNPALFATNMNSFSQSLGSAMASAPSGSGSGGGGYSGGGFGGGGGGSW